MDARRRLVSLVLDSGLSVSAAAREMGVSRQTAHVWLGRARVDGIAEMTERSRRPHACPARTDEVVVARVLELAREYPDWGAPMLHRLLPADVRLSERTVGRILRRAGRTVRRLSEPNPAPARFERAAPNELWQMDFKKLGGRRSPRETANVVDDCTRFCVASAHVPDQTFASVWSVLWHAFGSYGMPDSVLTDNGSAFRNNATWRWSTFDLQLMLLGIRPIHGRPYHPQTQGKVERFHGTLEHEVGRTLGNDESLQPVLDAFRDRYNWVRPHRALGMLAPGARYTPSERRRPDRMPEPFFPDGAVRRRCDEQGIFTHKGQRYKMGRAFSKHPVGILHDDNVQVVWGEFALANLEDFRV